MNILFTTKMQCTFSKRGILTRVFTFKYNFQVDNLLKTAIVQLQQISIIGFCM